MKKLTASIFTVLLGVVSVNAADAAVASKGYVDQEVGKANTAISAETSARTTAVSGLQASIDAINNAETGILAQSKDYTDGQITELRDDLTGATTDLSGLSSKVDTNAENIGKNTAAIGVLNGNASTEGSVAKSIVDALVDYSTTSEVESKISTATTNMEVTTNKVTVYDAEATDDVKNAKYTSVTAAEEIASTFANAAVQQLGISNYATKTELGAEKTAREQADQDLQASIDAINNADTGTLAQSKAYTDEEIDKLDTAGEITTANQVIVAVSETDGVISARSSAITGDYITDGTVLKADLDSGVQASLDLADSALQSENVNWLAKNLNVPTECSDATNYCVLTYNNTGFVWEVIARGTEGDNNGK